MTSLAPALPNSTLGRLVLLFILVILGMLIYGTAIDRLGVTRIRGLIAAIRGNG
jgi:hypothetical protein